MNHDVAVFVSASQYPPNAEDRALLDAFARIGVRAHAVIWDQWRWQGESAGVIRSTWDYAQKSDEFRSWIETTSERLELHNPLETILWSMDKRYLLELEERGIPVIDQVLVPGPDLPTMIEAAARRGWDEFVAKSIVSAGGRQIVRVDAGGRVEPSLSALPAHVPVLVQPFVSDFTNGEYSVICIGGEVSHAVLKRPAAGEFRVQDHYGGAVEPVEPPRQVWSLAVDALDSCGQRHSYARVDIVDGAEGPRVVELELLEPELFLPMRPGSAELLASTIAGRP